jgi:hypothetical protein
MRIASACANAASSSTRHTAASRITNRRRCRTERRCKVHARHPGKHRGFESLSGGVSEPANRRCKPDRKRPCRRPGRGSAQGPSELHSAEHRSSHSLSAPVKNVLSFSRNVLKKYPASLLELPMPKLMAGFFDFVLMSLRRIDDVSVRGLN